MMVKVFKANENGKIELTIDELTQLLEEAEAEGRKNIIITQPLQTTPPTNTPTYPQPWWPNPICLSTTTAGTEDTVKAVNNNTEGSWAAPACATNAK